MGLITEEQIRACDIEGPIAGISSVDTFDLSIAYFQAAKKSYEARESEANAVYALFHNLCEMSRTARSDAEPFRESLSVETWSGLLPPRARVPSDIAGEQNTVLGRIAPDLSNPVLRARIADIVWWNDQSRRDMAKTAVRAYTDIVRQHFDEQYSKNPDDPDAYMVVLEEYLTRAFQICELAEIHGDELDAIKSLVIRMRDHFAENNRTEYQRIMDCIRKSGHDDLLDRCRADASPA